MIMTTMQSCILPVLAIILLCGCDEKARIQVQDQASKAPLTGVAVRWTQIHYPTLMNAKINSGQLRTTDSDGWVQLNDINVRKGGHTLEFSKIGYATTQVIFFPHVNKIEVRLPKGGQNGSQSITNVVNWTNVLVIPLIHD